ncbi:MAG: MarR family transcriptional regulator [Litorimonas sp.]
MSVIQKPVTSFAPKHNTQSSPTHLKKFSRTDCLTLWYNVTLRTVRRNEPDLTTRQLALFMCVYLEKGPHTVRSLALELGVTKAVISRALNRLCKYNFILRADDPNDGRSVLIKRTSAGIQYLQRFGDIIHQEMPDGARLLNWH